jgi:phosphocarrier protein
MTQQLVTIKNRAGIHARPAALLVQTAGRFASKVFLEKDGERVNGKSIMGIITLAATYSSPIRIIAEGVDEKEAVDALARLFENKFEED